MKRLFSVLSLVFLLSGCEMTKTTSHTDELQRISFLSFLDQSTRDYFVYLPSGYHQQPTKQWPVLFFLHGNGERGNGQDELGFVLKNGPLYEAWIQKKPLPFIIVSPQLPMFDFDQRGLDYINNRQKSEIPQRLEHSVPERPEPFSTMQTFARHESMNDLSTTAPLLPLGWEQIEDDLLNILESVSSQFRVNRKQRYLSGLSYGGFGTWYLASKHPEKFAAIAPVVGWGHPSLMKSIAKQQLPVWQFAGGKDSSVPIQYFYAGLDELAKFGHKNVRFTVHEDMGHDAWTRVYASVDFYQWLLTHSLPADNQ